MPSFAAQKFLLAALAHYTFRSTKALIYYSFEAPGGLAIASSAIKVTSLLSYF